VNSIYDVPKMLNEQRMPEQVCRKLGLLWRGTLYPNFDNYNRILKHLDICRQPNCALDTVKVAIVAKYTGTPDTYLSLIRALEHAAFSLELRLHYEFIDAESLETSEISLPESFDHILVPGGFGSRGIEGKMVAIRQARESKTPYLGICLGMQLFVIEYCRSVLGLGNANSTEFDPKTPHPVVQLLSGYGDDVVKQYGGTMRLGDQVSTILPNTLAAVAYHDADEIVERHRHRYEVSPYYNQLQQHAGLKISAWTKNTHIPDIIETTVNGWWAVSCQFHPEFLSRNDRPHPLFVAFLKSKKD
jgi:CTP synthase